MNNNKPTHPELPVNSVLLFLLGAAVGATAMLLYSPMSGSEVRAQIADKAIDVKDMASEWTEQASDKATEWKDKAISTAHNTIDKAAEAFKAVDAKLVDGHVRASVSA